MIEEAMAQAEEDRERLSGAKHRLEYRAAQLGQQMMDGPGAPEVRASTGPAPAVPLEGDGTPLASFVPMDVAEIEPEVEVEPEAEIEAAELEREPGGTA